MSVYLHDIPLLEAQRRLQQALAATNLWGVLRAEEIQLDEAALGRVLAQPIWAVISSPHYHSAAMDGFAVHADSSAGAQPSSPVTLAVKKSPGLPPNGTAEYVDTGDALPAWANAVIPIENVESLDEDGVASPNIRNPAAIRIRSAIVPWSHVRPLGEDIVATQLVLPSGHVLRPVDLGAIAASGHGKVVVACKPRVAIIPTGTELVPIGSMPDPGRILEYNSLILAAQIVAMGGEATRRPIVSDDLDRIADAVRDAAQDHDLILLNAGSSAGAEDFSARVIERLGVVLVHGVAVRPGHPVIIGMIGDGLHSGREGFNGSVGDGIADRADEARAADARPIIGVPGFPVSAALTIEIFVEPLIAKWLGRAPLRLSTETAELTRKINSPAGDEDYVRVAVGKVGERLLAAPLPRGAGVISSLVHADGLLVVPPGTQGIEAGYRRPVRLYRSMAEIERTIFCIGSHDLTLDLLVEFLAKSQVRFVSSNVGSQAGLIALERGHGHIAGSHLLDPRTGAYNISYVRQYMPTTPVKVVGLVGREQGLIVPQGNPLGLSSLRDLTRGDVQFLNRQRGSGTRVLLDYQLGLLGISPQSIHGYNDEEYTHLGVAAAVAGGRADCGLAIAAAAQALKLDFVPLFKERYDLVIPRKHANTELLAPLLELLGREDFRQAVSVRQGYDISVMGKVIVEDP
jgi:putative molybdopterin biosynthesis protein